MSDRMGNGTPDESIRLADLIVLLRNELIEAQRRSQGDKAMLVLAGVELEAAIEMKLTEGGDAGVSAKFFAFAQAKAGITSQHENRSASKITLKFTPADIDPVAGDSPNAGNELSPISGCLSDVLPNVSANPISARKSHRIEKVVPGGRAFDVPYKVAFAPFQLEPILTIHPDVQVLVVNPLKGKRGAE